jgi:hypothetical protein
LAHRPEHDGGTGLGGGITLNPPLSIFNSI